MYIISNIEVKGLAGNRDIQRFKLNEDLNIFWGLNGSGKTSLLRLASAALQNSGESVTDVSFTSFRMTLIDTESGNRISRSTTKEALVRSINSKQATLFDLEDTEITDDDSNETVRENTGWTTKAIGADSNLHRELLRMRHTFLPTSRFTRTPGSPNPYYRRNVRPTFSDESLAELFAEEVNRRWSLYSSRSLNKVKHVQQQGLAEILSLLLQGVGNSGVGRAAETPINEAFGVVRDFLNTQNIPFFMPQEVFETEYDSRPELRTIVHRIQEITREMDEIQAPQTKFLDTINGLLSDRKRIDLDTSGRLSRAVQMLVDDHPISLKHISSGERQLIHLMLIVMTSDNRPVLIDEPEISLHVDWQEALVPSMRSVNPSAQLLLATHSPEIMAHVSDEKIFKLA